MENFERTKKYAEAFWEQEMIDRPYTVVTAPKKGREGDFIAGSILYWPQPSLEACETGNYERVFSAAAGFIDATYYAGEALPCYQATLGPDEYAAFLGCSIHGEEGYVTTWADPIVKDWDDFTVKIHKDAESYYRKMEKYLAASADFGKDLFLVSMLDLHSNLDAMSALRGPQDLCFDMMDYPEQIERALNEINDTYEDIYNMVYKAGRMAEQGTMGWSPIYCEDRSAVIQCDFACMISPEQSRKYLIPSLVREASFLDHSVYHYDGKDALRHIDDILAIEEIDCIQWIAGAGQPRTLEWMDLLKKIQSAGKSLWIFDWTAEEIKAHYKELEPNKVAFSLSVGSQDEADELLEYLEKNT